MATDIVRQFAALKAALVKEKREIEQRLSEINSILGDGGNLRVADAPVKGRRGRPPGKRRGRKPKAAAQPARGRKPAAGKRGKRNAVSLREAVVKVTSEKPMAKAEIVEAVKGLGYKFTTKTPVNSLGVVLYGKNPKFKSEGGKFSPAG